jgi:tetratricopeptide (TPR) repeat protein
MVAALLLVPVAATAQIPDEFTNLKLLDPDIEKPDLVATMRGWTASLGVRCNHCHVGPDNLQGMDFSDDEKATKRTARRMLEMLQAINDALLADLPVVDEGVEHQVVSCYTCHRGQAKPPRNLPNVLAEVATESGTAAALDEYRSLRADHYGAGRYDFREESLSSLARTFAEAGDSESALAVLDGAKEFFADSPSLHFNKGMIRFGQRDLEGARGSFEKALTLDADFEPAKRALGRLIPMMEPTSGEPGGKGQQ